MYYHPTFFSMARKAVVTIIAHYVFPLEPTITSPAVPDPKFANTTTSLAE